MGVGNRNTTQQRGRREREREREGESEHHALVSSGWAGGGLGSARAGQARCESFCEAHGRWLEGFFL